jgi:hypothetical protein
MDKPSLVGQAIRRVWLDDTQRKKAEAFDQIKRILAFEQKKRGPKGPQKNTQVRRTVMLSLWTAGYRGIELCSQLQQLRIPLPSEKRRTIYGNYAWRMWFQEDFNGVYRQINSDLSRLRKNPLPSPNS